jgi:hypothetical protein
MRISVARLGAYRLVTFEVRRWRAGYYYINRLFARYRPRLGFEIAILERGWMERPMLPCSNEFCRYAREELEAAQKALKKAQIENDLLEDAMTRQRANLLLLDAEVARLRRELRQGDRAPAS